MITRYSYKGCIFECRLKNAIKAVGCVPWDYPIPPSMSKEGNKKFCNSSPEKNGSTLLRFDAFMNSGESMSNCECMADCEEVVYKTQVIFVKCTLGDNLI